MGPEVGPSMDPRTTGMVVLTFVTVTFLHSWRVASEKVSVMARRCEICDKGPVAGRTVSHAHNVGPRRFEVNLQTVRAVVNGATKKIRVCTRCIRSKKVVKAA
jgi:large subunit ribosomal protein L28